MRISGINPISFNRRKPLTDKGTSAPKAAFSQIDEQKGGIYVKPIGVTEGHKDTISRALGELEKVKFSTNDVIYMQNLGANVRFKSGKEAVDYIKNNNIKIAYAEFSNPDVHACLDTSESTPVMLINSTYQNMATFADILAISEAMFHEASHADDGDSINSIQEEIDCLAVNVLAHEYYKKAYPGVFDDKTSPLFTEGVSLYQNLFFEFDPDKTALKKRIAEKYGFLEIASPGHNASKLAIEIKKLAE